MKRRARAAVIAAAGAIIVGGAVVGWRVRQVYRDPLRYLGGIRVVCEVDADHPYDPTSLRERALAHTIAAVRARIDKQSTLGRVDVHGTRLDVEVAGLGTKLSVNDVASLLTRPGRLDFTLVDDDSEFMNEAARRFAAAPVVGVVVGRDSWTEMASGTPHSDVYLRADDENSLRRAWDQLLGGLRLPPDHAIAFEHRTSGEERGWRSYYIFAKPEVDADRITDAEVNVDPATGRPEISLTFDREGAQRLEAVTARAVGSKLAILVDGRVNSAPVIESKIAGGRARISLGGLEDPTELIQQAREFVSVLRVGSLAAPVRIIESTVVPPR